MSSNRKRTIRNTVIGGAVALVAGAALIGPVNTSGADFTASDTGNVAINTANLTIELSDADNTGTFTLNYSDLAPGGSRVDTFTVKNTGSIAADVKFGAPISNTKTNAGADTDLSLLKMSIGDGPTGSISALPNTAYQSEIPVSSLPSSIDLGALKPGQSRTYSVKVSLDKAAGNEWQNKSLSADVTVTLKQR